MINDTPHIHDGPVSCLSDAGGGFVTQDGLYSIIRTVLGTVLSP